MNRWLIYGIVSLLFLAGLVAWFDKAQVNALRSAAGLAPLHRSEAAAMGTEQRASVLEEIAAHPVPGLVDDAPPTLGEAAEMGVVCVAELSTRPPGPAASRALRRYLLVLATTGLEPEHPVVEPRLAPLHALIGQGPMAALELARNDGLGPAGTELLAEFHRTYADPDHPLHDGLELHGGTFDALDFEAASAILLERWREVGDCVTGRLLPPLADWERLATE